MSRFYCFAIDKEEGKERKEPLTELALLKQCNGSGRGEGGDFVSTVLRIYV